MDLFLGILLWKNRPLKDFFNLPFFKALIHYLKIQYETNAKYKILINVNFSFPEKDKTSILATKLHLKNLDAI
jgi:hypothetical protein